MTELNVEKIKILVANDHAGFSLKKFLIENNPDKSWKDLGSFDEKRTDYPDEAEKLCKCMEDKDSIFGLLICGSGQGMAIKANRYSHIRAAIAWNEESARLSREHNKANVLCLGSRLLSFEEANHILKIFIQTPFKKGRHIERINKL